MASSEDTEITLGTGKLLVLFFGLVAVCALFFAMGYSLGRKAEPAITTASAAVPQTTTAGNRVGSGSSSATQPMTFYKSVEQKDANTQLTPPADAKTDSPSSPASAPATTSPASAQPTEVVGALPSPGYLVQVAAVSKEEDADALVDALKKKDYPAFVAPPAADKLLRVQVGPFSDVKEAEAIRTRLIADGYSPILKK